MYRFLSGCCIIDCFALDLRDDVKPHHFSLLRFVLRRASPSVHNELLQQSRKRSSWETVGSIVCDLKYIFQLLLLPPVSHPLLKLWSSSVHWMWTSSWFSSWSAFPHVMVKSFMSLKACRRESMVSAVIWIITPSNGGGGQKKKKDPLL